MSDPVLLCGTGNWTGPKPGDPNNDVLLSATTAFGGVDVSWSYPTINPAAVAHINLYRGITDDIGYAVPYRVVTGNYFFDKNTTGTTATYFYWIQIVSVNGTEGSIVGPASAVARATIEETMEMLTGRIDAGALANELKADIGNVALLGQSITDEVAARIAANQAISATLSDTQEAVDTALTLLETETQQRITENGAVVTSLNLLASGFGESVAGVATEVQAITTKMDAMASWQVTTEASINGDAATGTIGITTSVNELTDAIDGMLVAKLSVNGLIGGFGIHNDGNNVEAGFDVDNFWIGRTQDNKRKPFIIDGATGETYIDKAVIPILTADKIDSRGLTIRDKAGNTILSAGSSLADSTLNLPGNVNGVPADWLNSNLTGSISAAQNTANAANVAASEAVAALTNLASDSILSPSEKPRVIADYDLIIAEQAGITAQATTYQLTTEETAYTDAVSALTAYLGTLTGWDTLPGSDVVIVGTTFRQKFLDVYVTKQTILNTIYTKAKALADAAKTAADAATDGLVSKLNATGAAILTGPVSLNAATAIMVGDTNNGLYLGNTGIVGRKGGQTTFAVDQAGDATFGGALNAATGSFAGSLQAATGTFAGTLDASSITTGTLRAGVVDVTRLIGSSTTLTAGSGAFIVPAGMTRLTVIANAGGGGGGSGGESSSNDGQSIEGGRGGNGGRGGRYAATFDVSPGQVVNYSVGAGSAGGTDYASGQAGGNVSFTINGQTYYAYGGGGGGAGQNALFNPGNAGAHGGIGGGGGAGGAGLGGVGGVGGSSGRYSRTPGASGTPAHILFENYQTTGLVSRTEWENLMSHMNSRLNSWSWP